MKEVLLLKCGEIVLKGLNRKTFEDRLLKNLKRRMAHVADCEISMRQSVVYVEIPEEADADAVMECACRVFGFATISRAAVCPEKTLESVIATAKDYLAANFAAAKTFKVETKRGDKKFPMTSTEIRQHRICTIPTLSSMSRCARSMPSFMQARSRAQAACRSARTAVQRCCSPAASTPRSRAG